MSERDPRVDPQPGDVLRKKDGLPDISITNETEETVTFISLGLLNIEPKPHEVPKSDFLRWAKNAEVINRAE